MEYPVIALLTDYGTEDFFVASLKAVILSIQPEARIVDISHSVRSFDVRQASYLLASCYKFFPERAIFVIVIDPGVGTGRRILLAKIKEYFFIAPDNGVLSDVLRKERSASLISVTNKRFFLRNPGRTFEGRDKMAPVAAWLSRGYAPGEFGPRISKCRTFLALKPEFLKNRIRGHVVYIDKFGNCLTDIPSRSVLKERQKGGARKWTLAIGGKTAVFRESYSAGRKGELIFLPGSQGTMEIAMKEDSAAAHVGAVYGETVLVRFPAGRPGDRKH
jgi:S-adenosylmethionine hydrolase